ncbi:MAG TPA: universal stress protein [Bdellovibrio sp.]|uniref:universal stress protein n=1 Tax=Bdellovibrio sp. TaxID=28201 RepID=UPI002F1D4F76
MKAILPMKRAVWAVDVFEEQDDLIERAAQLVAYFNSESSIEIQPVHVLTSYSRDLPAEFEDHWLQIQGWQEVEETWEKKHIDFAKERFVGIMKQFNLKNILEPAILNPEFSSSDSDLVDAVSDFAFNSNADFIIANTHGKRGLDRFMLGSFAETLLMRSKVPVLIAGYRGKEHTAIRKIFFPTEFGEHSRDVFRRVISFAKLTHAEVILYHVAADPSEPKPGRVNPLTWLPRTSPQLMQAVLAFQSYMDLQVKRAEKWRLAAEKEGITVTVVIETDGHPVDLLIHEKAIAFGADLIMMEAQRGPIRGAILGSNTRKVVRQAETPVFVFTYNYFKSHEVPKTPHGEDYSDISGV